MECREGFDTDFESDENVYAQLDAYEARVQQPKQKRKLIDVVHDHTWEFLPYINYGLLRCRTVKGTFRDGPEKEVICQSQDMRTPDLGTLAGDLVRGHPEQLQVKLLKRFIKNWTPALQKFCPRGMSYFLPKHLGGLGLPIVGTFSSIKEKTSPDGKKTVENRERFSRCQLVLASYLSNDPERQQELSSMAKIGRSECFSIWQRAAAPMKQLTRGLRPVYVKGGRDTAKDEENREELAKLISPLLIRQVLQLSSDDLAQVSEESDRYAVWRKEYEDLFDRARRSTFPPLTEEQVKTDQPFRVTYEQKITVATQAVYDLRHQQECDPVGHEEEDWALEDENTSW
jgi:hypothetical protein